MGIIDSIDLNPNHLATVKSILAEHVPECEVRAFGSRATWTAKDYSDLDLAVVGEEPLDWRTLGRLKEAFEESDLPMRVDVLDWHAVSDNFKKVIESGCEVVWEKAKERSKANVGDSIAIDYGTFRRDFQVDSLANLCSSGGGIQTGPFGSQLHKRDYVPVGTPIITVEHLGDNRITHSNVPRVSDHDRDRLSRYMLRRGDIVFSRVGSVDRRGLVSEEEEGWLFSGRCLRIRPDAKKVLPAYLSYYFGLPEFQEYIRSIAVGATMPSLNTRILSDVLIAYPTIPEQRTIAHVLGTLDDKIELNRRMNETLEEMARALFKSWFVDFDPVRAKMEGSWRRGESLPGLPTDLYDLFPNRLVDSEFGKIPEGWEVTALEDVSNLNPESWSNSDVPAGIEYVDLANTKWGVIESTQKLALQDAPSRARRILRSGDTIVGTVRPGNGSYSLIGNDGLTGSTGFAVLRPLHPRFRELVYLAATDPDNIERLAHRADGAAYPAVRPGVVSGTEVIIPVAKPGVVNWFSKTVGAILDKIESAKTESLSLAAQRDTLLPGLVSGEIQVVDLS